MVMVHHARKGNGSAGDSILGSTAIFASVATALILDPQGQYPNLPHL